jgi:alkylhydroperoxidase/carboxymuconolactone decarboxylase family protein YurZ
MMATELEQELERGTALRGFRHGLHDFVAQVDGLEALKQHNEGRKNGYLKQSLIDRKTKELLMVVAIMAQGGLVSHIQIHMHAAFKAGASPEEIREAIDLVGFNMGATTKMRGIEAWRATFRPDVPTIDRVVELR